MKYPQYENYKDSRLNWLETIPENWEVKRIKFISKIFGRIGFRGYNADDLVDPGEGAITLGAGQIDKNDKIDLSSPVYLSWEKYEESPEIKVRKGDIIFGQRGSIGKVAYIDKEYGKVTINPSLILLKDIKLNPIYLTFFLQSPLIRKWVQLIGNSTAVPMISQEQFANFPCLIPPTEEQQSIANFLDKETARLDALIAKKQQLIETLKEKQIAIISHAVTKGLNPNVQLKESKKEWLDKIPKHWSIIKLKWFSKIYSGGTPDKNNEDFWDEGTIPWINSGTVNQEYIISPSHFITKEAFQSSSAKWIPKGALVMALAGQGKTKGMVAQLGIKTTCNQSMAAIIPDGRAHPRYILYWLMINYQNIRNLGGGNQRDGLNLVMIGNIQCPIPPFEEQVKIVDKLDSEGILFKKLSDKTQKAIDKLIEHKTALISAAVTGKIKVPEQA